MARRHHYKRRTKPAHELDITTFLNLMVVLVPFLLITAVFSRLTIVELTVPSSAGGAASAEVEAGRSAAVLSFWLDGTGPRSGRRGSFCGGRKGEPRWVRLPQSE